jgi:hypothetical protein
VGEGGGGGGGEGKGLGEGEGLGGGGGSAGLGGGGSGRGPQSAQSVPRAQTCLLVLPGPPSWQTPSSEWPWTSLMWPYE